MCGTLLVLHSIFEYIAGCAAQALLPFSTNPLEFNTVFQPVAASSNSVGSLVDHNNPNIDRMPNILLNPQIETNSNPVSWASGS